jgi:hypothetical protein
MLVPPAGPAASYLKQGVIHLLLSRPHTVHIVAHSSVPYSPHSLAEPASSIQDNTPSGASLDFSVDGINDSTHTARCFLLKTQVRRAGHRYRPLDVLRGVRASAFTVPSSTCSRKGHVPEVTPPHTELAAQVTSSPAGLPTQHDFTASKKDTVLLIRSVRTHAIHAKYIFLTEFPENDHPFPPSAQEPEGTDRRRTTGRSSGHRRGIPDGIFQME